MLHWLVMVGKKNLEHSNFDRKNGWNRKTKESPVNARYSDKAYSYTLTVSTPVNHCSSTCSVCTVNNAVPQIYNLCTHKCILHRGSGSFSHFTHNFWFQADYQSLSLLFFSYILKSDHQSLSLLHSIYTCHLHCIYYVNKTDQLCLINY